MAQMPNQPNQPNPQGQPQKAPAKIYYTTVPRYVHGRYVHGSADAPARVVFKSHIKVDPNDATLIPAEKFDPKKYAAETEARVPAFAKIDRGPSSLDPRQHDGRPSDVDPGA